MPRKMVTPVAAVIACALVLAGCNLPAPGPELTEQMMTAAAQTVQAALTPLGSPAAATATLPPNAATFTFNENTNCREGPGVNYGLVTTIPSGTSVQLVAHSAEGDFWLVAPPGLTDVCWVSAEFGTASGNFQSLPEVTPAAEQASGVPARPGSLFYNYTCPFGELTTTLSWTDSADNETGYRVYRFDILLIELPANSTGYVDEATVTVGTPLQYSVGAFNSAGAGPQRTVNFACE